MFPRIWFNLPESGGLFISIVCIALMLGPVKHSTYFTISGKLQYWNSTGSSWYSWSFVTACSPSLNSDLQMATSRITTIPLESTLPLQMSAKRCLHSSISLGDTRLRTTKKPSLSYEATWSGLSRVLVRTYWVLVGLLTDDEKLAEPELVSFLVCKFSVKVIRRIPLWKVTTVTFYKLHVPTGLVFQENLHRPVTTLVNENFHRTINIFTKPQALILSKCLLYSRRFGSDKLWKCSSAQAGYL